MKRRSSKFSPAASATTALLLACCAGTRADPAAKSHETMTAADGKPSLARTQLADAEFQQIFPGVAVHFAYGGIGLGVPTGQLGQIDAGLTFPAHSHSDDCNAVIIKGRFQHWEVGDADQGPVMLPGAIFFQGKDTPHFDSCLGPEHCLVYVTFAHRADVTPAG